MKKLTLIFTLLFSTVMFSSPSYAIDNTGAYAARHSTIMPCSEILSIHATTNFDKHGKLSGTHEAWRLLGVIEGYITGTNQHAQGSHDFFSGMSTENIFHWIASYCRANPSGKLFNALNKLFKTTQSERQNK